MKMLQTFAGVAGITIATFCGPVGLLSTVLGFWGLKESETVFQEVEAISSLIGGMQLMLLSAIAACLSVMCCSENGKIS